MGPEWLPGYCMAAHSTAILTTLQIQHRVQRAWRLPGKGTIDAGLSVAKNIRN